MSAAGCGLRGEPADSGHPACNVVSTRRKFGARGSRGSDKVRITRTKAAEPARPFTRRVRPRDESGLWHDSSSRGFPAARGGLVAPFRVLPRPGQRDSVTRLTVIAPLGTRLLRIPALQSSGGIGSPRQRAPPGNSTHLVAPVRLGVSIAAQRCPSL